MALKNIFGLVTMGGCIGTAVWVLPEGCSNMWSALCGAGTAIGFSLLLSEDYQAKPHNNDNEGGADIVIDPNSPRPGAHIENDPHISSRIPHDLAV